MKNIAYIVVVLFLVASGYAIAASERTIDSSNEFGGITKESVYSTVDEQYKEGTLRIVRFLNSNGILRKREDYYTDAYAKEKGISKMVNYSDSNKKAEMYDQNGNLIQ
jgi:hypothetical protein